MLHSKYQLHQVLELVGRLVKEESTAKVHTLQLIIISLVMTFWIDAGRQGFRLTMTVRRDRLATELKEHLHTEKVTPTTATQAKVMRFQNPIFAIKQVQATDTSKAYTKTHCSFQYLGWRICIN